MTGISRINLLNYKVLKTSFELIENYEFKKEPINIAHNFSRKIDKIDENKYGIILGFDILQKNNTSPIPFNLEIVIMGVFEFKNWEDSDKKNLAENNATAILFPYLRNLISTVTLNGNVPPYVLPIMNIVSLFEESEKKKKNPIK